MTSKLSALAKELVNRANLNYQIYKLEPGANGKGLLEFVSEEAEKVLQELINQAANVISKDCPKGVCRNCKPIVDEIKGLGS